MEKKNVIPEEQCGFRKYHNTQELHKVLKFKHQIVQEALKRKINAATIFIGISKAAT